MSTILRILDSSVSQKAVAAATGIGLIVFVVVHMLGNLQVFLGQDALNSYAVKLKSSAVVLWSARLGLLGLIAMHMAMTFRLYFRNRVARPGKYAVARPQASTRSSRNMAISGSVILLFVVFHLAHFTFGWIQPDLYRLTDLQGRHDVYSMVVRGFQNWGIAAFYIVCLIFLCSHLSHAVFSAWQSLGASVGGKDTALKRVASVVAAVTVLGFASIPIAVMLGLLGAR